MSEVLVFSDPLDSYNLLLLASSKLELYDYLLDNIKTVDETYLNRLLEESKNSINASTEFENTKAQEEVSELMTGTSFPSIYILKSTEICALRHFIDFVNIAK